MENSIPDSECIFLQGCQGDVNHINVNPTPGESDISKIDFDGVPRSIKHAEHMGRVISSAVPSVCSVTEELKTDKISYMSKEVIIPAFKESNRLDETRKFHKLYESGKASELPYKEMDLTTVVAEAERIIRLENGPDSFPFSLSAIKIGELVFAGIGKKVFTEIGNLINEKSPFK